MFRRSRFSARPNVGATGRTSQEAPSASQEAGEAPRDAETGGHSVGTPSERPEAPGDGNEQHGESTGTPAALQRRKRFSIKPKVAPGRPSAAARTQQSPLKAVAETPVEAPVSGPDKPTASGQTATAVAPRGLQSPRRRRSSEESKQPKTQPKQTAEPSAESAEKTPPPADGSKGLQSTSEGQVEGVASKLPDTVPFSILGREAMELSERAKTLVSSTRGRRLSSSALSLSRLLNDPSDIQRIAKAQKLRDLLKQEMHKEKKRKKGNARVKEYNLDPAKMTMSDLIRYLPESNPMTSSIEESAPENETVVPPSPERDASPERSQKLEVIPKIGTPRQVEEELDEEEDDEDDSVMVPQVKVAEDGTLIIDEESLTVEVQRAKGPNPANDRDPIFERGSTTTYASFRKGTYTKPWSSEETDMFFLAVSMVGTDFSMICQLFPLRARSEIKNKFKKEERENSWRVDKAFRERRKLDIEYFSKLLEKILEVQENRKKLRSLAGRKSPKKTTRKAKGNRAARKLSVVEEEDEDEQNEIADLEEEEGEKENEELVNEGGADVAKPKKKRKRKSKEEALTEEPIEKKNKTGEKSNEKDDACTPGDTEAALPEDCPTSDMSKEPEGVSEAKEAKIKPAKLSRGRAPKPLLPLGRKWGKKPPAPSTKSSAAAPDEGEEGVADGGGEDQVNKDASPLSPADETSADDDSEEEDATVQPPKPTRYGRLPKAVTPLNYPAKEAAPEATPDPPKGSTAPAAQCPAKRGRTPKLKSSRKSKKPKLVTIVASQSDYSDEEEKQQEEEEEEEEVEELPPAGAPFVPASLRSLQPVVSQVEETLEELDIFANIPDVLGISQDALCPEVSCEGAEHEADTAKPTDHQLDLLVDVIDLFSVDHTEVSEDESYNEAAQTLLTIGNLAHLPQDQTVEDHVTGTTLANGKESIAHLKEEIASKPALLDESSVAPLMSATSDHEMIETSDNVTILHSGGENEDIPLVKCSDQRADSDADPDPQLVRKTKKGGSSEGKPKPNLGRASRTPLLSEETQKAAECSEKTSCLEAKGTDEPSGSQEGFVGEAHSDQSPGESLVGAPCVPAVVVQKEESEVGSTPLTRKSRFQKVKPKLHLARTSRTKPQTTADTVERDADPTPNPRSPEKTTAAVEAEPIGVASPDPPTVDFTATEERFGAEDKKTAVEAVGREESGAETSDGNASENQRLSEASAGPARQHAAEDGENGTAAEGSRAYPRTASVSDHAEGGGGGVPPPAPCVTRVEELPAAPREEEEEEGAASARQTVRRRSQKAKPKPNVPHTSRSGRSKPETEDPAPPAGLGGTPPSRTPGPEATEEARPTRVSGHLEKASPIKSAASVTELRSSPKTAEETSPTEEQKTGAGRGPGSGQSVPQRRQRFAKVKPNVGSSPRSARAKRQSCDPSHADPPPAETAPPSTARSPADPTESAEQPLAGSEEDRPAAPNTESTDSASRKAPQALRGRLIRPKPSLARSGRPPPPRQVPETKAADGDFDAPVRLCVSEVRPDAPPPAEGAAAQGALSRSGSGTTPSGLTQVTEQPGQRAPPTHGPSLGRLTRAPGSCTQLQGASTSITTEIQTQTNVSIFPDLPLKDEQKDADEPFFILSLTEIPVAVPEPPPRRPAAEQDGPQPPSLLIAVPGEGSTTAAEGPSPGAAAAAAAACPEESVETGLIRRDTGPDPDRTPPTKPDGPRATRRRVKEQVEPRTSKRRQAGRSLAADEAVPTPQAKVFEDVPRGDRVDVGEEAPKGESGSGAQTARRKGSRKRNPKGFPAVTPETIVTAPPPDAAPRKAASKGPKARTPRAAAKRPAPPAASTSRAAAAATRSTVTTSPAERRKGGRARSVRSPPEVSASRQSDAAEEEPTSVSQYFLCDIFTDVEEG
ncbi:bdp1 [Pungitius sinensis]